MYSILFLILIRNFKALIFSFYFNF